MQILDRNPLSFAKFKDNIRISVGNGNASQFWKDPWVNGKSLSTLYPRISNITMNKEESLTDVLQRKEELFKWDFQFRRNLFLWEEEELNRMFLLFDGLNISVQISPNLLSWNACNSRTYFVSSMYNLSLIPISN